MRVLIADDDRHVCDLLASFVVECGHEVVETVTAGGLAAIRSFAQHEPDLVLLDIMMPQFNGTTACLQMRSRTPGVKIVFVTGLMDGVHARISQCRAAGLLLKPFTLDEVRTLLDRLSAPATVVPVAFRAA
jgi:DNA-binding response OmpR family regulator